MANMFLRLLELCTLTIPATTTTKLQRRRESQTKNMNYDRMMGKLLVIAILNEILVHSPLFQMFAVLTDSHK